MSEPLAVALIQLQAFDLADHEQAWTELLRRIDDAAAQGPRLIVAPEAAYPAFWIGSREAYAAAPLRSDADVLAALGERARRHGCYLVAGLVLRERGGLPQNAAVLLSPQGVEVARATEATPEPWFGPGGGAIPVSIDGTPVGLVAGDDARNPRQLAGLSEAGARLLIGTRAGTAWGRTLEHLPEPEAHAILAARAVEAGAWAVAPGKVGVEAGSRAYAGRAGVVDPRGTWVVRAPAHQPGVVLYSIDLDEAPGAARFGTAEAPGDPPYSATPALPATASSGPVQVAVVAIDALPSAVELMERLRAFVRASAAQGAALVVLPDLAGADARAMTSTESLPLLQALARETGVVLAVGLADREAGATYKTAYLIDRGEIVAAHRQSRLDAAERAAGFAPGADRPPVVATGAANIALLSGVEGLVPSVVAGLPARGASLIAWCVSDVGPALEALARTRAIELQLPVVVAGTTAGGGGVIVGGTGAVLAVTLAGRAMAAQATLPATRG